MTTPLETDKVARPRITHRHFSKISRKYRNLRVTDLEPVLLIRQELKNLSHMAHITAADIGCGDGRYDLLLCKYLGNRLHLYCLDANRRMLRSLTTYMREHEANNFQATRSDAAKIPLRHNSIDCLFTFNAIHHFEALTFLHECSRVLRLGGYLFIYTRTREQNKKNVWGEYFPLFWEKETRLYKMGALEQMISEVPGFRLKSLEFYDYKRTSTLERLEYLAMHRHYSTFSLYSSQEWELALDGFRENIRNNYSDPLQVEWTDENIMLVIEKNS
ncbi:class I SAM-dependent methyltransferase [Chloroflexota bacterium]